MSKKLFINEIDLTNDFRFDHTETAQSLGYNSSRFLTSWWKFEELAAIVENNTLIYDYSSEDNHGVYHGDVEDIAFTSAPGQASGAYLPGNVYVEFPPMGMMQLVNTDISLSFWVKIPGPQGGPGSGGFSQPIKILNIGNNRVQLYVDEFGILRLQLGIIEGEDATSFVLKNRVASSDHIANDHWHFISYTYDSETFRNSLYLDGQLQGEYTEEEIYASSDELKLSILSAQLNDSKDAVDYDKPRVYPAFSISDLATWNAELKLEEVQAIYNRYLDLRVGRSGFMGYPAKVLLNELDNSPNSYPTIHRADSDIGFGTDLSRPYDDSKTVIFDSAYANAWIKFYNRPRDASTITLHDPAGSIDLLPATAAVWTTLDDLTVSANDDLKVEQVYQVLSYKVSSIKAEDNDSHDLLKTNDYPSLSGLWSGVKNVSDEGGNIILEDPSGANSHHEWIGSDEGGLFCRITVTSLGMPDPDEGGVDDYYVEYGVAGTPLSTLRIESEVPNISVEFSETTAATSATYDANVLSINIDSDADPTTRISDVVN